MKIKRFFASVCLVGIVAASFAVSAGAASYCTIISPSYRPGVVVSAPENTADSPSYDFNFDFKGYSAPDELIQSEVIRR